MKKVFEEEALNKEKKKKNTSNSGANSATLRHKDIEPEQENFEDATMLLSKEEREAQSLHIKIENILPRIYVN